MVTQAHSLASTRLALLAIAARRRNGRRLFAGQGRRERSSRARRGLWRWRRERRIGARPLARSRFFEPGRLDLHRRVRGRHRGPHGAHRSGADARRARERGGAGSARRSRLVFLRLRSFIALLGRHARQARGGRALRGAHRSLRRDGRGRGGRRLGLRGQLVQPRGFDLHRLVSRGPAGGRSRMRALLVLLLRLLRAHRVGSLRRPRPRRRCDTLAEWASSRSRS